MSSDMYIYWKSTDYYIQKSFNFCEKIGSRICNICICIFAHMDQSTLSYGIWLFSEFLWDFFEIPHKNLKDQNLM